MDSSFAIVDSNQIAIYDILSLKNGSYYLASGGAFQNNLGRKVARVFNDGIIDSSFESDFFFNGPVFSVDTTSGQDVVFGGLFWESNIVKLDSTGAIDQQFLTNVSPGFDEGVYAIDVQPDGKIIVGGLFSHFNLAPVNGICRLNPDGTLDQTFNATTGFSSNGVRPSKVQYLDDGKILVSKRYDDGSAIPYLGICRLNSDGTIDTGFESPLSSGSVNTFEFLSTGKILIGGNYMVVADQPLMNSELLRISEDGNLDTTFLFENNELSHNIDFFEGLHEVEGGNVIGVYSSTSPYKVKPILISENGSIDTNLVEVFGFDSEVHCSVKDINGKFVVGGEYQHFDTSLRFGLTRFIYSSEISSVDLLSGKSLIVYPNPTDGTVFLEGLVGAEVSVLSGDGRLIDRFEIQTDKYEFDMSSEVPGVYFLSISVNGHVSQAKLVLL